MNTAQESLFIAMLNNGWFTASDGNVESPTGYFGYVVNEPVDLREIRIEFEDTISAYGDPGDDEILGVWFASINDQGIIRISRIGDVPCRGYAYMGIPNTLTVRAAQKRFNDSVHDYIEWSNHAE